jgi:hypothetical protein
VSGSGDPADDPSKLPATVPLREEIEGVLEDAQVPEDKREQVVERVTELVLRSESYEGSLTHPRIGAEWERIVPGAGATILALDAEQIRHRIECEHTLVRATTRYGTRAQYIGASLIALPVAAAFYLAITGHTWNIVGLFLGPPIIGAVVAFINRQISLFRSSDEDDDTPNQSRNLTTRDGAASNP